MGPMLSRRFTATKEDSAAYRNLTKRCVRRLLCGHMLPQTPHHGMHAPQHQHTKLTIVRFITPEARAKLIRGTSFPRSHRQVLPPPATHASPDHGVIPAPNAKFLLVNGKNFFSMFLCTNFLAVGGPGILGGKFSVGKLTENVVV